MCHNKGFLLFFWGGGVVKNLNGNQAFYWFFFTSQLISGFYEHLEKSVMF